MQVLYSGLAGPGSIALSLAQLGSEDGWKSYLCFVGVEQIRDSYVDFCSQYGVEYDYIATRRGLSPLISLPTVAARVLRWRPDVLIVHSAVNTISVIMLRHFVPFKLISIQHTPIAQKRIVDNIIDFISFLTSDRIVFLTKEYIEKSGVALRLPGVKQKAVVIRNGIDTTMFSPHGTS